MDKGFTSTTRDPFYSPGLKSNFGLVLIKVKIPANKNVGLLIENFSLFPKEEEFLLPPYSKFKLLSKDDNFKYYHINSDFEKLITAKDFGTEQIKAKSIQGGNNVKSSAKIFIDVLQNKGTKSQEDVVCANAGMAIATALDLSPTEGFKLAKESLTSGKAFEAFNKLQNISKE